MVNSLPDIPQVEHRLGDIAAISHTDQASYNHVRPHSSLSNKTPAEARRALEQFEGSTHDVLAQNETKEYEIHTRKLSL